MHSCIGIARGGSHAVHICAKLHIPAKASGGKPPELRRAMVESVQSKREEN
jgi:hypothetical protein